MIKKPLTKKYIGCILTQKKTIFNRITENKKLSKFVAPKNKSFLTAEITYSIGDSFSKKTRGYHFTSS